MKKIIQFVAKIFSPSKLVKESNMPANVLLFDKAKKKKIPENYVLRGCRIPMAHRKIKCSSKNCNELATFEIAWHTRVYVPATGRVEFVQALQQVTAKSCDKTECIARAKRYVRQMYDGDISNLPVPVPYL